MTEGIVAHLAEACNFGDNARPSAPQPRTLMLDAALSYAARGWRVLPVEPRGKRPLTPHGHLDATTDEATIRALWARWPDANVGIACAASGLVVLDVDGEHGRDLLTQAFPHGLPTTLRARTGREGGEHLYFAAPEGVRFPRALIDDDTAAEIKHKGYVVAPPSVHPSGRAYEWITPEAVAPAPAALMRRRGPQSAPAVPVLRATSAAGVGLAAQIKDVIQRDPPGALTAAWTRVFRGEPIAPIGARETTLTSLVMSAVNALSRVEIDAPPGLASCERRILLAGTSAEQISELFESSLVAADDAAEPGPTIKDVSEKLARALTKRRDELGVGSVDNERCWRGWVVRAYSKPTIMRTANLVSMADQAEAAMLELDGEERIYSRAGTLVHVVAATDSDEKLIRREPGAPLLAGLPHPRLRELLSAAATWHRPNKKGQPIEIEPPQVVAETLMARGRWRFDTIEGITEVPLFRADGSIMDVEGFDAKTGLLYRPSITYPRPPDAPTREVARAALDLLLEPFSDFPFRAASDRSALGSAILSIVGRPAIDGPIPMHSIDAPVQGTGKTLAAQLISLIGSGRRAASTIATHDDDEMRKRLLSIGLEGAPVILVDNVDGVFGTASLASVLTGESLRDRILGINKTVSVRVDGVWLMTANNASYAPDMPRRIIPCTLDAKVERPELRGAWKHDNIEQYVISNRGWLTVAALTVLRAFHIAGRPGHGQRKKGSYERWDDLVRAALIWLGAADPNAGTAALQLGSDPDAANLRALISAWKGCFTTPTTISTAVKYTVTLSKGAEQLRDALQLIDDGLNPAKIGYKLRSWKSRVIESDGQLCAFESKPDRTGVGGWFVAGSAFNAGDAGDCGGCPSDGVDGGRHNVP
jgi:hypothetical protein